MHDIKIPTPEEIGVDPFTCARELGIVCQQLLAVVKAQDARIAALEAAATAPAPQPSKGGKHAAA